MGKTAGQMKIHLPYFFVKYFENYPIIKVVKYIRMKGPKMEKKLLDLETALERLGGDKEFLIELLQELLQQVEEELPKLKKAIEEQNYDEVRSMAHGLKGAAANLGADKAMEVFFKLEMMGKEQNLDGASEALEEAQRLNAELKLHLPTI